MTRVDSNLGKVGFMWSVAVAMPYRGSLACPCVKVDDSLAFSERRLGLRPAPTLASIFHGMLALA